jgi:CheY-like chemotaxis protein
VDGVTRVLVIEDTAVVAEMLRVTLDLEGHEVHVVDRDFTDLLDPKHLAWHDTDVVVSDLMLPGTTGLQLLAVARDHHPHLRRVALTAADSDLRQEAAAVADIVLSKPSPWDAILTAIVG